MYGTAHRALTSLAIACQALMAAAKVEASCIGTLAREKSAYRTLGVPDVDLRCVNIRDVQLRALGNAAQLCNRAILLASKFGKGRAPQAPMQIMPYQHIMILELIIVVHQWFLLWQFRDRIAKASRRFGAGQT